ncbi:putative NBD/HSP70 family sugar kinase [Rhizobium sp. BK077]|uniref:ROK family transcriptional regulator n=1 Tax=unclassified Rhizobium TaxID=2613769 RepID=UPI0016168801|nr:MULTISPECIES: ROK family transcriptional regulator [unclassified Rhizobium]MBB3302195.1 putative NBD/HSP70 family sugar kinase [Rhizobium sp. BK112]MBB3371317.1 putative NBD/HSP70 family sugar kinase [Rhizobium sp. BK077]MBB4182195.1 putative NBD/HSP70 family sugar kinase [Rhizobium sp. BK109]MBB4255624.1 putative NBD/HSP70 family sugar kinase [Rhizobium sp. BK008]
MYVGNYRPQALIGSQFMRGDGEVVHPSERAILKLLWNQPHLARSEVTSFTDLSQQSVYRIIDQLAERGLVSIGTPKPGVGRGQPSPTLKLNGEFAYACGISLNTDIVGICLIDLAGDVIAEGSVLLRGQDMQRALEQVRGEIARLQGTAGLSAKNFFGIGFAIAAFHVGGTRYNGPLPLHEWSLIELGPLLSDFFQLPVWVNNNANTAAVAESMFGVGRHVRNFAYLSFNYGFGGGLISDGELLLGGNGNAGSFSQMYDDDESKRRPALQFLMELVNKKGVEVPSIEYMRKNFDRNWPGVSEWIDEIAPGYNRLVNALRAIFDPQAIVFGGQIPEGLAQMLIAETRIYERSRYGVSRPVPKLMITEIASDASAMGAAVVPFRATYF